IAAELGCASLSTIHIAITRPTQYANPFLRENRGRMAAMPVHRAPPIRLPASSQDAPIARSFGQAAPSVRRVGIGRVIEREWARAGMVASRLWKRPTAERLD